MIIKEKYHLILIVSAAMLSAANGIDLPPWVHQSISVIASGVLAAKAWFENQNKNGDVAT